MSCGFRVLLGHLPGSAHHYTLSPWLHQLYEGAMVKETTLPGTLWTFIYREDRDCRKVSKLIIAKLEDFQKIIFLLFYNP